MEGVFSADGPGPVSTGARGSAVAKSYRETHRSRLSIDGVVQPVSSTKRHSSSTTTHTPTPPLVVSQKKNHLVHTPSMDARTQHPCFVRHPCTKDKAGPSMGRPAPHPCGHGIHAGSAVQRRGHPRLLRVISIRRRAAVGPPIVREQIG
jgi:hypothetical protein